MSTPPPHNHDAPTSADQLHEHVSTQLAEADHRYTDGRRQLVEVMAKAGRPLTLPDIIESDPDLPQSSVYRNLDVLERSGVIQRIVGGSDHSHYELSEPLLGHHHHLICTGCGAIEDIHLDAELEALVDAKLTAAATASGFAPSHHSLDMHGLCPSCQA